MTAREFREFRAAAANYQTRAAAARRDAVRHALFGAKPELALAHRLLACARRWRLRAEQGTFHASF